jgi:hypothetical protein
MVFRILGYGFLLFLAMVLLLFLVSLIQHAR